METNDKQIEEAGFNYGHKWSDEGKFIIASRAFENGAKSEAARQYWQRGMYSKKEVKKLCKYAMEFAQEKREYAYELIEEWFEQNKKK